MMLDGLQMRPDLSWTVPGQIDPYWEADQVCLSHSVRCELTWGLQVMKEAPTRHTFDFDYLRRRLGEYFQRSGVGNQAQNVNGELFTRSPKSGGHSSVAASGLSIDLTSCCHHLQLRNRPQRIHELRQCPIRLRPQVRFHSELNSNIRTEGELFWLEVGVLPEY